MRWDDHGLYKHVQQPGQGISSLKAHHEEGVSSVLQRVLQIIRRDRDHVVALSSCCTLDPDAPSCP